MISIALLSLIRDSFAQISLNIECNPNLEYFDSSSLTCRSCPSSSYPDHDTTVDPNGNALSCICSAGSEKIEETCTITETSTAACNSFYCSACSSGISYSDYSSCSTCGNSTANNEMGNLTVCSCPSTMTNVLYETDLNGDKLPEIECTNCSAGSLVVYNDLIVDGHEFEQSKFKCQTCSTDDTMNLIYEDGAYDCQCISSMEEVGVSLIGQTYCLLSAEYQSIPSYNYIINYDTGNRLSLMMKHYYPLAATKCQYFRWPEGVNYCQLLANLCVLTLYASSSPCNLFNQLQSSRQVVDDGYSLDWSIGMPWLTYSTTGVTDTVPVEMSFDASLLFPIDDDDDDVRKVTAMFRLVTSSFSTNGTWLGYHDASSLFKYCDRRPPFNDNNDDDDDWIVFGSSSSSSSSSFSCDVANLKKMTTIFYDLYLIDETSGDLIPIPVQLDDGQLVRRFFLIDVDSGSSSGLEQERIRYASSIHISVKSFASDPSRVHVPVVSLSYASTSAAAIDDDDVVVIDFSVDYYQDYHQFMVDVTAVFIFLVVVSAVAWIMKFRQWKRRNERISRQQLATNQAGYINYDYWSHLIIIGMSVFVKVIFPFIFLVCTYIFCYFKLQKQVYIMLPSSSAYEEYDAFKNMIYILFVFQIIVIFDIIITQSSANVMLIDWETVNSSNTPSVWRSILALNEWNELATCRKSSTTASLLIMLFACYGLNLQYYACPVPNTTATCSSDNFNPVLSFANCLWWIVIASSCQIIFKYCIHERLLTDRKEYAFIDMCTIAKISVLIFDEPYHGYYLHCKSSYPKADTSMSELIDKLSREECGLTSDRSLEGGPDDVQSFEVFVTDVLVRKLDKIKTKYFPSSSSSSSLETMFLDLFPCFQFLLSVSRTNTNNKLNVNQTHEKLSDFEAIGKYANACNKFLKDFIDSSFDRIELKREVKEISFMERYFSIPPDMMMSNVSNIFYADRDFKFSSVMFLGREVDLLLFNLLSLAVALLWLDNNIALAACITWIFDSVVVWMRSELGKKNLARRTRIDERFLI